MYATAFRCQPCGLRPAAGPRRRLSLKDLLSGADGAAAREAAGGRMGFMRDAASGLMAIGAAGG